MNYIKLKRLILFLISILISSCGVIKSCDCPGVNSKIKRSLQKDNC